MIFHSEEGLCCWGFVDELEVLRKLGSIPGELS
jgi:hypothetical protein